MEGLHTLGLSLLVFRVLPRFDALRALLLLSATCLVPALLKLFATRGGRGPVSVAVDVLAVGAQGSVFFLLTLYLTRTRRPLGEIVALLQAGAALLLVSVRYWENFVDQCAPCGMTVQNALWRLRVGRAKVM